jgi:glycogen synthase
MRILIATDSFPPNCGGSGWSTFELARGLRARGHVLTIVQPRPGQRRSGRREYDGFVVDEFAVAAPQVPYVRNYFKNERLTRRLASYLGGVIARDGIDIVHAQHVLTGPPSIAAANRARIPSVCTVRDYWPVCYWSDLIHDYEADSLCPACTTANMTRCIRPRAGAAWPMALPMIPYMHANLARKRASLASASAVVAVSRAIAADLQARAPELAGTRVVQIPNPVDVGGIVAMAAATPSPMAGPYAVFAGKLEPNKGAGLLVRAARDAGLTWPLVVAGDGSMRAGLESEAAALGVDLRVQGWRAREEALRWVAHSALVVFPSHGPESLSRVLLEASALARPIAAMDTGGTRDIIEPGLTGLLSTSAAGLALDIRRLVQDRELADRLGRAAAERVREQFDAASVVSRIEALYEALRRETTAA